MTKFNLTKIERDDMITAMQANDSFNLQPPEGDEGDEDSLGELSTNDSIKIEIVEDDEHGESRFESDEHGEERWSNGYEPYEPNVYDGTYSEM